MLKVTTYESSMNLRKDGGPFPLLYYRSANLIGGSTTPTHIMQQNKQVKTSVLFSNHQTYTLCNFQIHKHQKLLIQLQ